MPPGAAHRITWTPVLGHGPVPWQRPLRDNDVNDWGLERGDPRYIIDLVKRIVTVSVETRRIVRGLPELREAD